MGGLGNGRRGGRSPPLMIGALIACILLLGFNYWVSSSRNLELQTKLYELEGQVRRGAAERGVSEMRRTEFQEEVQKQKDQLSHMEALLKKQLEGAQNICALEKGTLQHNISSSAKTIQELKGQLNRLNDDMGRRVQKERQSCEGNIKTLNDKLTYDMTHCQSQILSQKELCDERVAAVQLDVQKKMEKLTPPSVVSSHEYTMDGPVKDGETVMTMANAVNSSTGLGLTPSVSQPKEKDPPELLTNEITVGKGLDAPEDLFPMMDIYDKDPQSVPSTTVKQDIVTPPEGAVTTKEGDADASKHLENNLTEDKEMELMDAQEEDTPTEEEDLGMDGMLTGQVKADESLKPEEPEEYDADEHVVGGEDLEKEQQMKQTENIELADYNGDDENEGEFEADKQAELAQI